MLGQEINTRSVVFNLIMINVVVFIISTFSPGFMEEHFALFYPANPHFQPIQLVSHLFMHAGIFHIFFNMFALFMFGNTLERVWGPQRFLTFYFITGFGAVLLHLGVAAFMIHHYTGYYAPSAEVLSQYPEAAAIFYSPTLGASGAIYGVLVGFGVLFPNTEMLVIPFPFPIKAKYLISVYVLIELYSGISMRQGDNVAHFAHLGGALFGYLLVKYWNRDNHYLY